MLSIVTVYNYAAFWQTASIIVVHDMPSGVILGTMRWGSSMGNSCVGGALANIGGDWSPRK